MYTYKKLLLYLTFLMLKFYGYYLPCYHLRLVCYFYFISISDTCTSMCVCTFIAAQLDICKQSYLDNLPEEPEHQVGLSLLQILCSDVDDLAADGRG